MLTDKEWCVYLILGIHKTTGIIEKTYIGISTRFETHRLRQHRKEIKGGAKSVARWGKDLSISPCCIIRCSAFDTHLAASLEYRMKPKGSTIRRYFSTLTTRQLIKEHIHINPIRSLFECLHWNEINQHPITITWYLPEHTPSQDVLSMLTPFPDRIIHVLSEKPL